MTYPEPDLLTPHIVRLAWQIYRDLYWSSHHEQRDWNWVIHPETLTRMKKYQWSMNSTPFVPDLDNPGRFLLFGIPITTDAEPGPEIELRIRR